MVRIRDSVLIHPVSGKVANMKAQLAISRETFPLQEAFVISRGAKMAADVVCATISGAQGLSGHGECVPYGRYGETLDSVVAQMDAARHAVESGCTREALQTLLPAGAARNALDCALWDFDAKRLGIRAHEMAGLHRIAPATTAVTLSIGDPDDMARAAAKLNHMPLLKIKLGGNDDIARINAVRTAAPACELIVDANEAWREDQLEILISACAHAGISLIEQPLPAGKDHALARIKHAVPICADESVHDRATLSQLRDRYDAVNIKLDKSGGLTEALALTREAQSLGFAVMVGSMVGTSLGAAPAMLLTPFARWTDLDGPLLLAHDRNPGLAFDGAIILPPQAALWG